MNRRDMLTGAFKVACATPPITALAVERAAAAAAEFGKVVYHLSDLDKVDFVFANIRNHYIGMGGPDHVTIALVVHGSALQAFHLDGATPDTAKKFEDLRNSGLQPAACINSMRAQNVTLKDLLPGFTVAEKGGVVRLAELQSQGYAYLRP
ncbi:MAG TPA: DsrE family protein [Xanthobacteraceae bacterium]|nr:DsrE family protein [Xanthobacteraceae bacterium]